MRNILTRWETISFGICAFYTRGLMVSWVNIGPTSRGQYQCWANVRSTCIVVLERLLTHVIYSQFSNIRHTQSPNIKVSRLVLQLSLPSPLKPMLSWKWRCSWSSADRRCSNYIWVINNFIAYYGVSYIKDFMVCYLPGFLPAMTSTMLSFSLPLVLKVTNFLSSLAAPIYDNNVISSLALGHKLGTSSCILDVFFHLPVLRKESVS